MISQKNRLAISAAVIAFAGCLAIAGALTVAGGSAVAQSGHESHGASMVMPAQGSAAAQAYDKAMTKMHKDMDIKMTGDADRDFVRGMIPHHQGAVDMARVLLQYGKDPELRKMAEEIIAAQEGEIAKFNAWLAKASK